MEKLGTSVIFGGITLAFGLSIYATRRSPDCSISKTAFRAARLELLVLLIVLVLSAIASFLIYR